MKIIIDGDACPRTVKDICVRCGKEYGLEVCMVIDKSHEMKGDFTLYKVEQGNDSVDHKIVTLTEKNDIIITQDYGLASLTLDKAKAIHPNGLVYTKFNIETLLFQRHISSKMRKAGKKTKGPKKRKQEDDLNFLNSLRGLLK